MIDFQTLPLKNRTGLLGAPSETQQSDQSVSQSFTFTLTSKLSCKSSWTTVHLNKNNLDVIL